MEKEKIWYELPRLSKQCQCCNFYYFVTGNFKYCKYFCDGCFFCRIYEKDSKGVLTLWIIKTTKGSFRTVSSYFYKEVEESLTKNDLNEKYGWIYWTLVLFLKNLNVLTVESPCGIEPQSLINENLTIRLWRFTPTAAVSSFLVCEI